jgi:hypothetical protein
VWHITFFLLVEGLPRPVRILPRRRPGTLHHIGLLIPTTAARGHLGLFRMSDLARLHPHPIVQRWAGREACHSRVTDPADVIRMAPVLAIGERRAVRIFQAKSDLTDETAHMKGGDRCRNTSSDPS